MQLEILSPTSVKMHYKGPISWWRLSDALEDLERDIGWKRFSIELPEDAINAAVQEAPTGIGDKVELVVWEEPDIVINRVK